MSDTIKLNPCPKCGAPIPAGAPQGLCPKCVLAGAATGTDTGVPATATSEIPSLERVAAAFPQLEILELIGRGGMGFVFKARQPHLDRLVALKLLPDKLARDPRFTERFNREGRVLARLNHPNIVSVYDFGQTEHFYFLLMEYVDGVNLRQAMKAGRFSPAEALAIVPKICEALQYAHGEGILHRDIKPENILLDARGQVKIADFGIAKLVGEEKPDITLTATGAALGTPHYMAPEQLEKPAEVDHRADIYSLGVVFYEMLTGELPIGRFAPPSSKTPVGSEVDEVVFRTLEKDRERRFQSAGEMKSQVEHLTETGAFGAAGAVPGATPRPVKEATCRITTPEHARRFVGRFLSIHQGTGTLRLAGDTLSFERGWNSVTIPLRDIQALGIGHYSTWAKPVRLDYLVVTFTEHGRVRSLFFTPTNPGLTTAWDANQATAEWHEAVAAAVEAVTGKRPAAAAPELLGATLPSPLARALIFVAMGLAGIAAALAVFWLGKGRLPATGADWWRILPAVLPALAAMGWVLWREHRAHRIPERRATPPTPPALSGGGNVVPKWSQKAIWGAVLTGLSLPVPLLFAVLAYMRAGGLGTAELAIMLGAISLPGLAGVLLGWMALSDIRAHQGRLRGLPLAVFAALAWPLLVLVGTTVTLPYVLLGEAADSQSHLSRWLVLLVPVGTLTFAFWAVYAAIRWGSNQGPSRERGVLKWVFVGMLAVGIAILARPTNPSKVTLRETARPQTFVEGGTTVQGTGPVQYRFTVPPGRVVVAEFASQLAPDRREPIPGMTGYVVAPNDQAVEGELRLVLVRNVTDMSPDASINWQMSLAIAGGTRVVLGTAALGPLESPSGDARPIAVALPTKPGGSVPVPVPGARSDVILTLRVDQLPLNQPAPARGMVGGGTNWEEGLALSAIAAPATPADEGVIHFSILTVELREEAGADWLAMDYVANVQGDCERVFRVEADRFKVTTRTTERRIDNKAGGSVRHQRVEWKLPAGFAHADALQLRDELGRTLAGKSIEVRIGQEKPLLRVPLADLGTLTVTVGAVPAGPDAVRIRQAREQLEEALRRQAAGLIGRDEVARAEHALVVAEARGDAVAVAQANLKYADEALALGRQRFEAGVIAIGELRKLENQRSLAEAELNAARRRATTAQP